VTQRSVNLSVPTVVLGLRLLVCTLWAASMVVTGLWLGTQYSQRGEHTAMIRFDALVGCVGLVCLGQFVFATLVADRLFPRADKRIVGMCQVLMAAGVLAATLYGLGRVVMVFTAG
jgi:hypothetical protein